MKNQLDIQAKPSLWRLLFNHVDAWCVTFGLGMTVLLVHDAVTVTGITAVLVLTFGYWFAFCYNDWCDAPYDAQDPIKAERNYFVSANTDLTRALLFVCVGVVPAAVFFQWRGALLYAVGCFILWAYSAPPLRLKSRPIIDLITHAFFVETYPYIAMLTIFKFSLLPFDYAALTILPFASLTAQLEQQARDYAVDLATDRNFTTTFGLSTNHLLMRIGTIIILIIGTISIVTQAIPLQYLPIAIIAVPVFIRRFHQTEWHPGLQNLSYILAVTAVIYIILMSISVSM